MVLSFDYQVDGNGNAQRSISARISASSLLIVRLLLAWTTNGAPQNRQTRCVYSHDWQCVQASMAILLPFGLA
jgi:hypothetical protein